MLRLPTARHGLRALGHSMAASLATALLCTTATAATAATLKTTTLSQNGSTYNLSYYSNKTLTSSMPAIQRIVVVMHGAGRDGDDEFTDTNAQLHNSGADIPSTLLVAPQLYNEEDANAGRVPANTPWWSGSGWIYGYDSIDGRQLSSFALMDALVKKLTSTTSFPALTQIVLAGHSGGGQFFSRYAALTAVHDAVPAAVRVKYVIANPGSHLYFSTDRGVGTVSQGATSFAPWTNSASCPGFNTYKYGAKDYGAAQPFHYPVTLSADALFRRFAARQLYYYQGTADTAPYWQTGSNPPDADCAAVLSGDHRFARGLTNARYQRFLAAQKGIELNRLFRRVEGVGHNSGQMWGSACASTALFGSAQMLDTQGASCSDLN